MLTNHFLPVPPRHAFIETMTPRIGRRMVDAARLAACGAVGLGLAACASTVHPSTSAASFAGQFADFTYAEVEVVRQSDPRSCGLAALACVLRYWDRPVSEGALVAQHPVTSGVGHSLQTLQRIAQKEGLLAFALSLRPSLAGSPSDQLSEQIAKGRPVILAVRIPQGRYFGKELPVLGTVDARTLRPFGLVPSATGEEYKLHYVVVFGEDQSRYLLMDPAYGIVSVPRPALLRWWGDVGYAALVCSSAPTPEPPPPPQLASPTP